MMWNPTVSERWSTHDKFSIVVESATLSEIELAEYCRSKGLYVKQIQARRDACIQAKGGVAEQANQLQKNNREKERQIKKLSRASEQGSSSC
jgi:transposase